MPNPKDNVSIYEDIVEYADGGGLIVIHRTLNLQEKIEDEQHKNLFCTMCTIDNKVCGVVIEG